jgi:tetratricopeptide (TPR) repeat protein
MMLTGAAVVARAECHLPDVAPGAIDRMSPEELLESGHYLRAERVLEQAAGERNPREQWLLSRAKAALGELEDAMSLAEAAEKAEPQVAAYHVQVAAVAGRMAEKANLLKRIGYVKKAREELDAAVAADAGNVDARWGLMMYYFAVPGLLGGDKAKAQEMGEKLAADAPDRGRYYQGRMAIEMKDPERAETFYRQSVLENPLRYDTVAALASYYSLVKPDRNKAEVWGCQAVHADPTRGAAWALLARAYTMCGCWKEAEDVASHAEAIDSDDISPWYEIAAAEVARGERMDEAAALLRRYLSQPIEGDGPEEDAVKAKLAAAQKAVH